MRFDFILAAFTATNILKNQNNYNSENESFQNFLSGDNKVSVGLLNSTSRNYAQI